MTIIKYLPTQKVHYKRPLEAFLVILHCGACVPKEMHFVGHCVSLKSLRRISPSCVSNIPQKFKMKSNLAFIIKSSFFSYFSTRRQVKWMIPDEKYIDTLSSLIQVTGSLLKRFGISTQILLFQPGLEVKVCHVCYCNLVLNLSFLFQSNDDVIVTSTEICCVLYSNLVFD